MKIADCKDHGRKSLCHSAASDDWGRTEGWIDEHLRVEGTWRSPGLVSSAM